MNSAGYLYFRRPRKAPAGEGEILPSHEIITNVYMCDLVCECQCVGKQADGVCERERA